MINHGVNQRTKTASGIQKKRLKDVFLSSPPPPLSLGAFLPLWRTSGSTIWIWRKPTRNKDPTGGLNISWPRLLDWLTCGHKACSSWAWASGCRRPKPSTSTSATSRWATTAASSVTETVRSTRCAPCSTWTSCPTPSVWWRRESGSVKVEPKWRILEGFVSGVALINFYFFYSAWIMKRE